MDLASILAVQRTGRPLRPKRDRLVDNLGVPPCANRSGVPRFWEVRRFDCAVHALLIEHLFYLRRDRPDGVPHQLTAMRSAAEARAEPQPNFTSERGCGTGNLAACQISGSLQPGTGTATLRPIHRPVCRFSGRG